MTTNSNVEGDSVAEEATPVVEETPVPEAKKTGKKRGPYKKRKKAPAKSKQPKQADAPLSDIPTTPAEIKDKAVAFKDRAKDIGAKPIMEEIGGGISRLFGKLNRFLDDVEGKK